MAIIKAIDSDFKNLDVHNTNELLDHDMTQYVTLKLNFLKESY